MQQIYEWYTLKLAMIVGQLPTIKFGATSNFRKRS